MSTEEKVIRPGTEPMLTIEEASRLLHVHANTLRRWSDKRIIRAYRIGPRGDRRFKPDDIVRFLLGMNGMRGTRQKSTTAAEDALS